MTEALPITIKINDDLRDQFTTLHSVTNKLEAQFNFQALTANWYGDEEKVLSITLSLETPKSFEQRKAGFEQLSANKYIISHFSDDVIYCVNKAEQQVCCAIAMTSSEIDLLALHPKLLTIFTQTKLHKVLNLFAKKHSLTAI
ncbi:hypothetical protein [Colwellia ponticola]|uniref:Uncharacterized protein n=1 Tax=Colwellia ponticola TaxID=2304625 RepID=A0A8H2JPJ3_9GAMM|nr:hypothetical protein [Colwellia ponticola]TMM47711.1 hypothetical protein FCS21_01680 [Colwellia ponticola]